MIGAELIHGDRRTDGRYVFELPLRFLYRSGEVRYSGAGRTKDLGRKGICFVSEDPPPEGTDVELRIEWPFLLQDVCALDLRVWGRVLRNDDQGTVVRMSRYRIPDPRGQVLRSDGRRNRQLEHRCLRNERPSKQAAGPVRASLALKKTALGAVPPFYAHRGASALHLVHSLGAEFSRQRRKRPSDGIEHPKSALTVQNHQGVAQCGGGRGGNLQNLFGPAEK